MGRVTTVSEAKGSNHPPKQNVPKEGTKIRELYDLFMDNKGKILDVTFNDSTERSRKAYLVDSYGLDIRCLQRGKWCLVGEWNDDKYIDYVVQTNVE